MIYNFDALVVYLSISNLCYFFMLHQYILVENILITLHHLYYSWLEVTLKVKILRIARYRHMYYDALLKWVYVTSAEQNDVAM